MPVELKGQSASLTWWWCRHSPSAGWRAVETTTSPGLQRGRQNPNFVGKLSELFPTSRYAWGSLGKDYTEHTVQGREAHIICTIPQAALQGPAFELRPAQQEMWAHVSCCQCCFR